MSSSAESVRRVADRFTVSGTLLGALGVVVLLLTLLAVVTSGAWPAIEAFGARFLVSTAWDPIDLDFGAGALIYGTLVSSAIGLLIALPLSVGSAVFLVRLAPRWLAGPVGFILETLAAIPSIAFGFWAVFTLVPALRTVLGGRGYSLLAAGIVLALMILPIITAVTRDVLSTVPVDLEEGAYGMGATWWQTTWIALQYGRAGILGAAVLGLARAVGETMAVTMVIGNNVSITTDPRMPAETMASVLASQYAEASVDFYRDSMIYVALVLLIMTLIINVASRLLVARVARHGGA